MNGRGTLDGLESPYPLAHGLPGLYQEPERDGGANFAQRALTGLDGVLAPIFLSLDSFHAYIDPALAPSDFLDWLSTWLGLSLDERWPLERRRKLLASAVGLFQFRGTAEGVAAHVETFTGVRPEVIESGGTSWSTTADGPLPGSPEPRLTVRVRLHGEDGPDVDQLRALVEAIKPAHLIAEVEVIE
ncbi:MAG: phage tail protein [Actinomycetia bacterium]|nr:phage tail protein [Actinomycetes bacterium]